MTGLTTGYQAFRGEMVSSDQLNNSFTDFEARKLRYSLLWAMYENTAYDKVHLWADSYKTETGLYRFIRNIYNPSYRLGEFWKAKLLGGELDPQAGDGKEIPSALPIITENEKLRPAIAKVWEWSNWQIKKDVFGLWTPVLGDGVLKIVNDPIRKKAYLKAIHPSRLKDVTLDDFGNVKGYIIEYKRLDPRSSTETWVTYREVVSREEKSDEIMFETYLNNGLYAWDGNEDAAWSEAWGFVPMVVLQHNDVGLEFGWSELYPGLSKFREVDDLASKLHDQIRKLVEGAWLMAGVSDPNNVPRGTGTTPTTAKPQPGRTEQIYLYSNNADAKAHSLVAPIEIDQVGNQIREVVVELERDFPELKIDLNNATQDISGRALRENRAPVEQKVLQRRPNYDNALVRAHGMAVALAGAEGYGPEFSAFDLDSYINGELKHSIGSRPVFRTDPMDKLEEEGVFQDNVKKAKDNGIPLPVYLKQQGWDEAKINEIVNSDEYKLKLDAQRNAVETAKLANTEGMNNPVKKKNGN
jgi:hypothetical protein